MGERRLKDDLISSRAPHQMTPPFRFLKFYYWFDDMMIEMQDIETIIAG